MFDSQCRKGAKRAKFGRRRGIFTLTYVRCLPIAGKAQKDQGTEGPMGKYTERQSPFRHFNHNSILFFGGGSLGLTPLRSGDETEWNGRRNAGKCALALSLSFCGPRATATLTALPHVSTVRTSEGDEGTLQRDAIAQPPLTSEGEAYS